MGILTSERFCAATALLIAVMLLPGCLSSSDNNGDDSPTNGDDSPTDPHSDVAVPTSGIALTSDNLDSAVGWITTNTSCTKVENSSSQAAAAAVGAEQKDWFYNTWGLVNWVVEDIDAAGYLSNYGLLSPRSTANAEARIADFEFPDDPLDGDCGGSLDVSGDMDDNGGNITLSFDDFCVEIPEHDISDDFEMPHGIGNEITINGNARIDVEENDEEFQVEASIDNFNVSSGEFSLSVQLDGFSFVGQMNKNEFEASLDKFEITADESLFVLSFDRIRLIEQDSPGASSSGGLAQVMSFISSAATVSDPFLEIDNLDLSLMHEGESFGLREFDSSLHVEGDDTVYISLEGLFFNPDGQLTFTTPTDPEGDRLRVSLANDGPGGVFGVLRLQSEGDHLDLDMGDSEEDFVIDLKYNGQSHAILNCSGLIDELEDMLNGN
ncbi:hypothetical protein LRD18_09170 [Halorhodospira halochloris]|uniref:hypothetical protein n=1 Tax=Halorhodospira halochloris TaxID=1052 RepID=UPI001EE8076B|nr:hypothetical protein [Halorhodospira halochloris]MCG5531041.1 hypothetical protein [Halorhodospira halochloris]